MNLEFSRQIFENIHEETDSSFSPFFRLKIDQNTLKHKYIYFFTLFFYHRATAAPYFHTIYGIAVFDGGFYKLCKLILLTFIERDSKYLSKSTLVMKATVSPETSGVHLPYKTLLHPRRL